MSNQTTLTVLGATGFTGKHVALEVAKQIQSLHSATNTPFRWSIAGRRTEALEAVRQEIKEFVGASSKADEKNIQTGLLPSIVQADVHDKKSLEKLALGTHLILNCVGPYYKFGENVIIAVLEASDALVKQGKLPTHYIDLSGEPNYIERMVLNYRNEAKRVGSIILPASAYDSVPAEFGTIFAMSSLGKGVLPASVEMIAGITSNGWMAGHFATYACIVNGTSPSGRKLLSKTRKQLYSQLPKATPKVASMGVSAGIPKREKKFGIFPYDKDHKAILIPHLAADPAVVRLGQALTLEEDKTFEPAKFVAWFEIPSFFVAFLIAIFGAVLNLLVKFEIGRKLLLGYPKIFTAGVFSHEGPTKEQMKNTSFHSTFYARGFSESNLKSSSSTGRHQLPDVTSIIKVTGPEPGYIATSCLFVTVAKTILQDESKIPPGVSVPGAALRNTSLIRSLNEDGRIKFERIQ